MNYLIYGLNFILILLVAIICYWQTSVELRRYFALGLFLKLICGIIYGEIYKDYYKKGDTLSYFNEGIKLSSLGKKDFASYLEFVFLNKNTKDAFVEYSSIKNPRSLYIIKISSVFLLITNNSYWLTSCYLSLFAFLGIFYLMKILLEVYSKYKEALLISFLFFPSFVFWSSGLTKESIAIGSLFFMIAFAVKLVKRIKIEWWEITVLLITFWLLLELRSFYLIVFILTFGLYAIVSIISENIKNKILAWLVTGAILVIIAIGISKLPYVLSLNNFLVHLYYAYETNFLGNPENAIIYYDLKPQVTSILINVPIALFSGLFRPSLFDVEKIVMIFPALENLVLLLLFIVKLPSIIKKWNFFNTVSWIYVLVLALFLALSTPNFGSLMRYKVAFLPLLLFLLLKNNPLLNRFKLIIDKRNER